MRTIWRLSAVVFALACTLVLADGGGEDLERAMKQINKPYEALLKQIKDKSKNAESLKLVSEMQAATLRAKDGKPEHLPKEKRAEKLADYRSMMSACLISECEIEQALLDNDNETAAKKLDELTARMKDGHKEFRPKEEHHKHD